MGWGRTFLLGDIGNRLDIADCEDDMQALKRELRGKGMADQAQDAQIAYLQEENETLKLYVAAVTRLLIGKGVVTRQEIEKLVDIIDAEDGKADGKISSGIR